MIKLPAFTYHQKRAWKQAFFAVLLSLSLISPLPLQAYSINDALREQQDKMNQNAQRQSELEQEIARLQNEKATLANQVAYFENQIELTELQIQQQTDQISTKEKELETLTNDINDLTTKMTRIRQFITRLNVVMESRIRSSYKESQIGGDLTMMFAGKEDIQNLMYRYQYLKIIQEQDKKLLAEMQKTRSDYNDQINSLEAKKTEVEDLKKELAKQKELLLSDEAQLKQQKASKDYLLYITQNNESTYQQMLSDVLSEQRAMQSAFNLLLEQLKNPDNGVDVKRGDIIGVQGHSGKAFGDHLHFGLYNYTIQDFLNGNFSQCTNHLDPAPYINSGEFGKPINAPFTTIPSLDEWNANADYYADTFGITQVYGRTVYAQANAAVYGALCSNLYGFHQGEDLAGPIGSAIYAAADGIAYTIRGGDAVGNGVYIFHDNGLMTMYWHLQ